MLVSVSQEYKKVPFLFLFIGTTTSTTTDSVLLQIIVYKLQLHFVYNDVAAAASATYI